MIRRTSIETYRQIMSEGLLSAMREEVYKAVYEGGPCTSAEAFNSMNQYNSRSPLSQTRARFTELRDMGVLEEVGEKQCSITGRTAILWDVTPDLPRELPKKPEKRQQISSVQFKEELLNLLDPIKMEWQPRRELYQWLDNVLSKTDIVLIKH